MIISRFVIHMTAIAALLLSASSPCFSGGPLLNPAPRKAAERRNPYAGNPEARQAGAKLYERECSSCHGDSREGIGHAPPLNSAALRSSSPGAIFWVLRNGRVFRGMPSFSHLPEAQRWQIVTFLLSSDQTLARQ